MRTMKVRLFILPYVLFLLVALANSLEGADANAYHWNSQSTYFEGWYFKVSDPATKKSFLFIYAVYNPDGKTPDSTAFMMAGNNSPGTAALIYQNFGVETFAASYDRFDIGVGSENRASGDAQKLHAEGSVADATNQCSWSFDLQVTETWANTMGWMENLPNLQTYWYVGAMKARATGWIQWNNEYYEFENILGYQEKNWGDEFPETWYWLQANNFDSTEACCLSVGGASMPIGPATFRACGIGFRYKEKLYTFSFPQQPAKITADIEPGVWHLEGRKGRHKIMIDGSCDTEQLMNLMNPTIGGIKPWTWESVNGSIRVRLYEKVLMRWRLVVDTSSDLAGVEFGGKQWLGWNQK
jgi:tocopherol cyclase